MKIAVIGSRGFKNKKLVSDTLEKYFSNGKHSIISGGAPGVDKCAEKFAKLKKIPIEIIRPIKKEDNRFYLYRNIEIITKADIIMAFWNKISRGTKFVIDYANARKKKLIIYTEEE